MDQQVGAGAIFDDVVIVARVAGKHCDAAAVFDAIAVARLDHVAVVDLEGDHPHAVFLVDHAVAVKLGDVSRDAGERQLLVADTDLDVESICLLQVLD